MKALTAVLASLVVMAGVSVSASGEVIADSVTGFSSVQGANGWSYNSWQPVYDYRFEPWWNETDNKWQVNDGGIWKGGMHPRSTDWYMVLEWTSSVSGLVEIAGDVTLYSSEAAGVIVSIFSAYDYAKMEWNANLTAPSQESVDQGIFSSASHNITLNVVEGQKILFGIMGLDGIRNDATAWSIQISAVPEPASMALMGLGAAALLMKRRK